MTTKKKYDILQKISVLAEGDAAFEAELIRLYRIGFQELKVCFKRAVTSRNVQELTSIAHKYRTTFLMFDLQEADQEIAESRKILTSNTFDIVALNQITLRIEAISDEILGELQQKDS